jgi:hypothetical protein
VLQIERCCTEVVDTLDDDDNTNEPPNLYKYRYAMTNVTVKYVASAEAAVLLGLGKRNGWREASDRES